MSLYVVVEGRRTEPKIYRAWLPLLIPGLVPVARIEDAKDRHFYIVAGRGYPSYLDRIQDAVEDLRLPDSPFTHLVVCADAEEQTREERQTEIESVINDAGCPVPSTVIVADCCIETWLLGNRKLVRRNPQDAGDDRTVPRCVEGSCGTATARARTPGIVCTPPRATPTL